MTQNTNLILDIGCGINKIPDAVGMDIDPDSKADIIHDLNVFPYPINDNAFDRIYAKHIIEHLDDPQAKSMASLNSLLAQKRFLF